MSNSDSDQFKKDWIISLVSTSGIMLTICLMVLTIIYTSSTASILKWQKLLIALSISGASILLVLCARESLNALGTLILASTHREKQESEEAKTAERLTAKRARQAQRYFKIGLVFLIAAIVLSAIFLNWSIVVCIPKG